MTLSSHGLTFGRPLDHSVDRPVTHDAKPRRQALRHFLPRDSPRIPEDPGTGSTLSASLRQGNSGDLSTFPGSH